MVRRAHEIDCGRCQVSRPAFPFIGRGRGHIEDSPTDWPLEVERPGRMRTDNPATTSNQMAMARDAVRSHIGDGFSDPGDPGPPCRAAQTFADVATAYLLNAQARSDLEESTERSIHISLHDALTGLPNRTLLVHLLEHAVRRSGRSGRLLARLLGPPLSWPARACT